MPKRLETASVSKLTMMAPASMPRSVARFDRMLDPKETVEPRLAWSAAIMSMVYAKVSAGADEKYSPSPMQSHVHVSPSL